MHFRISRPGMGTRCRCQGVPLCICGQWRRLPPFHQEQSREFTLALRMNSVRKTSIIMSSDHLGGEDMAVTRVETGIAIRSQPHPHTSFISHFLVFPFEQMCHLKTGLGGGIGNA